MTTPVTNKRYEISAARLETISTAALIVCSMALIGLSTLKPSDLDWSLKMSLGCFAVGLPASCFGFMIVLERKHLGKSPSCFADHYILMILLFMTIMVEIFAPLVGVFFLFQHFSDFHGMVFGISSIALILLYLYVSGVVDKELSKSSE